VEDDMTEKHISIAVTGPNGDELVRRPLPTGRYLLGRDQTSDIVIDLPDVSRRHALIDVTDDHRVVVHDLDSTVGTYVDDARVSMTEVHGHEAIRFASARARIMWGPQTERAQGASRSRAFTVAAVAAAGAFALTLGAASRGWGPAFSLVTAVGIALAVGLLAGWLASRSGAATVRGWRREDTFAVAGLALTALPIVLGLGAPPLREPAPLAAGEIPAVENRASQPVEQSAPGIILQEGGSFTVEPFSGPAFTVTAADWNTIWSQSRVPALIDVMIDRTLEPNATTVRRTQYLANIIGRRAGQCAAKSVGHFKQDGQVFSFVFFVNGRNTAIRVTSLDVELSGRDGETLRNHFLSKDEPVDVPAHTAYFTVLRWDKRESAKVSSESLSTNHSDNHIVCVDI
jgi:hypothetical protein